MENVIAYAPLLAKGTAVTVVLALLSLALATMMGGLAAAGKVAGGRVARNVVWLYTTLVRGVPELVLLLLIYYGGQRGVNQIGELLGLEYVELSKFGSGVFALGFIYGAYMTETFRGAYLTVPKGQGEAALSLGLSTFQAFRLVVLPQLIRFALPGYFNVVQVLVKGTAVVSIIGLADVVGLAGDAGKSVREPFTFYFVVFWIYLAFTTVLTWFFNKAEKRAARGIET